MNSARLHLILAALFALIVIGGYVAWYLAVQGASDTATSFASDLATKEAVHSHAQASRDEELGLADKQAFTTTHLLNPAEAVSFLEHLEATGRPLGAKVMVVSVDDSQKANGSIDIALSVSGTFDAVMRTLGVIEHEVPATTAKTMTLSGSGGSWSAVGTVTVATQTP